jgi:hypothetical protein
MDKVTEITQLAEQISVKGDRFYNKGVKCSGTETRKLLQDMVKLCRDLRKDVLEKQKAMPKKESGNRVPPTRPKKQAGGDATHAAGSSAAPVQEAASAAPVAAPVQDAGATREVKPKQTKTKAPTTPSATSSTPAATEHKKAAPKPKAPKAAAAAH